jgi:alkanesulfonate monooxygenase SsuD/methylene tetrahydromethanopterin reductase-like flavin-dependent oxidoreductase (luciferase family)
MQESLEIIIKLWTQKESTFSGKYYSVKQAVCEPKPLQKPYPPITIGGAGEKFTLKATAQYANRADFGFLPSTHEYKHKLEVLANHCKNIGRKVNDIELSCWPSGQVLITDSQKETNSLIHSQKPRDMPLQEFRKGTFVGQPQECLEHLQPYAEIGFRYFMLYFGDLPSTKSLQLFAKEVAPKIS